MHNRQIFFEIACKKCKNIRSSSLNLWDDNAIEDLGREELIKEMDNFKDISCETCDTKGKWLCFNIYFEGQNEVERQLTVNMIEKKWSN